MIGHLKGNLTLISETEIIIDVGGIGFIVKPNALMFKDLPALGEEVSLPTYLHLREDNLELYGFRDREQLHIFKLLLKVSGIGPSTAMAMLNTLQVPEISAAINNSDIKTLCRVNGIGKKTAQRLILELNGELPEDDSANNPEGDNAKNDLLAALESLGYSRKEMTATVDRVMAETKDTDISELLRQALKFMAKE